MISSPGTPFTIVEFGSGSLPILTTPDAPDTQRLFSEGGRYVGIDADATQLQKGAAACPDCIERYASPGVEIETGFEHARIDSDLPLPALLEADSADRVIVSNVLTHPIVARNPDMCYAIANAAMHVVRKDEGGEVVVVGTFSPRRFTALAVTNLLRTVGLEHVGSDAIGLYYPRQWRQDISEWAYAERYKPK